MAHFAYVVEGIVERVHVVANTVITDGDGVEQESLGQGFLSELHGLPAVNFVQCSYNGNVRGNYPGSGWSYDLGHDAFIPPQPFDSWVLNEDTYLWEPPIPMPEDGQEYMWDEEAGDWVAANV